MNINEKNTLFYSLNLHEMHVNKVRSFGVPMYFLLFLGRNLYN
ncbi:hypothetical protein bmyco0001_27640 [Bacillus mycoides DSM 2048]|nr:hypothetical protein bmyco0001_27640 [Bacillus mycoides DSM 2048]